MLNVNIQFYVDVLRLICLKQYCNFINGWTSLKHFNYFFEHIEIILINVTKIQLNKILKIFVWSSFCGCIVFRGSHLSTSQNLIEKKGNNGANCKYNEKNKNNSITIKCNLFVLLLSIVMIIMERKYVT